MSALEGTTKQGAVGLHSFSLAGKAPSTRIYMSDFQTAEGELIAIDWELHNRAGSRFLDRVQVSTVTDLLSNEAGYAMGYSWASVQIACFGLSEGAQSALDEWIQGRLQTVTDVKDERRFVKRLDSFEMLLELSPQDAGRSRVAVTMSRDDSPGEAGSAWTSYCIHESLTQGQE